MYRRIILIIGISLFPALLTASNVQFGLAQYINIDDLNNDERTIYITDLWKYHAGDNLEWADREFDDFMWDDISTLLGANQLPFIQWDGIGWFRLSLDVDESLVGIPLALDIIMQSGASEVYLNGILKYTFGVVSVNSDEEVPYQERKPKSFIFTEPGHNVIAVRYSNHNAQRFIDSGYNAGFRYLLVEMNHQVSGLLHNTRQVTIQQFLFSGVLLVFTLIHLLLYLFYPKHHQNLYFALFAACFGALNYLNYQAFFSTSGQEIIALMQTQFLFLVLTLIFFLLFSYSLFYHRLPRQFWLFIISIAGAGIFSASKVAFSNHILFQIIVLLFVAEVIRILVVAVVNKKNGAWVFSAGMIIFIFSQLYSAASNLEIIQTVGPISSEIAGFSGVIALLITMSVSMSRSFAQTNIRLENKLREVQVLSQKAIEQEREKKDRELERLLLEADNKRKTQELEDARKLQLSMLPHDVPALGNIEIAVRMRTATEVGGDYYDFVTDDNTLTVAVGDATGHGVKAGIVVATAKSYFQSFAKDMENIPLLRIMSKGVKNMNLRALYMTITLLKYSGNRIKLVAAGMPPSLLYRAETGVVEILSSKGMPLGSVVDFHYKEIEKSVSENDVLLLMSDGLPEAFNSDREMLDLDKILEVLTKNGKKSPEVIIQELEKLAGKWTKNSELDDDYTLLVLKFHP